MKSIKLILFLSFVCGCLHSQDLSVYDLTCEHKKNPVGIDDPQPRLSWKIKSAGFNVMQTSYSIRVSTDQKFPAAKTVWNSGKVASDESVLIPYSGSDT